MLTHHVDMYIGDHPLDIEGAHAAGIPGIGVSTGAHTQTQLLAAGATWVSDKPHPDRRSLEPRMTGPGLGPRRPECRRAHPAAPACVLGPAGGARTVRDRQTGTS